MQNSPLAPPITYGDMERAQRWLIAGANKEPATGWTHPRIMRADGRQGIRIAKDKYHGGVMCTAATPESWLTRPEAAAICASAVGVANGWQPAYVHPEGVDDVFFDFDYHAHIAGTSQSDYERWRDSIVGALRELRGDIAALPSKSGTGAHVLFRLPREDLYLDYPKVVLPCPCGKPSCENGGKVENWIGKGARYRIQPEPLPPELAAATIPILTRAELATIAEFADEYNRQPAASELPEAPEFAKTLEGAATRTLIYLSEHGLSAAALESPDSGFYWAQAHNGEWAEFGDIESPQSLRLLADANANARTDLLSANVTDDVRRDFAEYTKRETLSRNLPEIRRQIASVLLQPDMMDAYGVNRATRRDFNRRAGRYLRTRDGVVNLLDGGDILSPEQVTAAYLTADAPALQTQSERGYTADEVAEGRYLCEMLIYEAWGIERFKILLWHCQRRKGNLFIVGGRNRGKGLLVNMLARLEFAEVFQWTYSGCPHKGAKPNQFNELANARTRRKLVVMDEVTGARGLGELDVLDDEAIPDNRELKAMQGAEFTVVERKHKNAAQRAITAGMALIANAAPCLPAAGPVYADVDMNFIDAPAPIDALRQGGLGYAPEVLSGAPALNRLVELTLEYLPQVAHLATAPITGDMVRIQDDLRAECQAVYDNWRANKRGK